MHHSVYVYTTTKKRKENNSVEEEKKQTNQTHTRKLTEANLMYVVRIHWSSISIYIHVTRS
jgi:hypothetical protein